MADWDKVAELIGLIKEETAAILSRLEGMASTTPAEPDQDPRVELVKEENRKIRAAIEQANDRLAEQQQERSYRLMVIQLMDDVADLGKAVRKLDDRLTRLERGLVDTNERLYRLEEKVYYPGKPEEPR